MCVELINESEIDRSDWLRSLHQGLNPVELVGGKALGLGRLAAAGLPVPDAFVVTTAAFRAAIDSLLPEVNRLLGGDGSAHEIGARCTQARQLIREAPAAGPVLDRVAEAYLRFAGASGAVAVRSSGVDEDGIRNSYAGEHDSHLEVRGVEAVLARVRDCWASLFTERAVQYRRRLGRSAQPMAVVVQKMVNARASGVLMTLNPGNGDRSVLAVESVWGLGEALVSGAVSPDRFLVNRVTGDLIRRQVARKERRLAVASEGGCCWEDVPAALVEQPSLEDLHLEQLHAWIERLEGCAGGPADVELALDDRLWVLQVRPETYWSNQPRRRPDARGSALQAILHTLRPTVRPPVP